YLWMLWVIIDWHFGTNQVSCRGSLRPTSKTIRTTAIDVAANLIYIIVSRLLVLDGDNTSARPINPRNRERLIVRINNRAFSTGPLVTRKTEPNQIPCAV